MSLPIHLRTSIDIDSIDIMNIAAGTYDME